MTERLESALEGKYRIERKIGEGGMATVFLAEDIKHERKVALKVLRPELAAVIGAERFLAEIKTTANLQHPHILPLFDSGAADGYLYYVMPFIDGETLRTKLEREKQLGLDEALRIATDVAEALDYAHRNDIIHRDIKPANILLHDGRPVVADFGIALAVSAAGGGRMTETGLSLGTPHYMSPEQATADRDLSPRSDVYSLGCVLYEMIAGQPPHTGPSAQSILVNILTKDPTPLTELRHTAPRHVAAVVAKSIEKLPADRFASAADFASALHDESFAYGGAPTTTTAPSSAASSGPLVVAPTAPRGPGTWALVGTTLLFAAFAAWGWLRPAPASAPVHATRLPIDLRFIVAGNFDLPVVSPDGSRFAVTGVVDGERGLYWRSADDEVFRLVPGTEGAQGANFSPDGDWIAYATVAGGLYKVSLLGGAPVLLVRERSEPRGLYLPNWGDDGTIVFFNPDGTFRISETGGDYALVPGFENVIHGHLLPGGHGVLGSRVGADGGVVLAGLGSDTVRELASPGFKPKYVDTGHVLYLDDTGGLWALPFDVETGDVLGVAVPVLDGVTGWAAGAYRFPRYSISRDGTLVYGTGGSATGDLARMVTVDLAGVPQIDDLTPRILSQPRWSPSGESVVYASMQDGDLDLDIYVYDVARGTTPRRLTFQGVNFRPVVSPDGSRVMFSSSGRVETDGADLLVKVLGDDSPATVVATLPGDQYMHQWVSDALVVYELGPNPSDLWTLDLSDAEGPRAEAYLTSEFDLDDPRVSPDGSLAAYVSNESGADEVYVRSFPIPGERTMISQGGGLYPRWAPDGSAVYYWTLTSSGTWTLWRARIRQDPTVVLSTESVVTGNFMLFEGWDLHPDGDRLVVGQRDGSDPEGGADAPRYLVVMNWFEEMRARMGG